MSNAFISFFYKPNGAGIYWGKVIGTIVLTIALISLAIYGQLRNKKLKLEREANKMYTIGITTGIYKNIRSAVPNVVYKFSINESSFTKSEDIPDYLEGKVIPQNGRYYVQYSSKDPNNCKLMLSYPVPDSVSVSGDGWTFMPGY